MKTLQGTITSLKNAKTAIVTVSTSKLHPLYKKFMKSTKKYACHYEGLTLELGQVVQINESKPLSKTKSFVVAQVVEKK